MDNSKFKVGDIVKVSRFRRAHRIVSKAANHYTITPLFPNNIEGDGKFLKIRHKYITLHPLNKIYSTDIYQALLEANLDE